MSQRVNQTSNDLKFIQYLESFEFDCRVRNLTPKTISVYHERLGYLSRYLCEQSIAIDDTTKKPIKDYILGLQGRVSDETINGRIRAFRRFFNFLVEEELWNGSNPMTGIKPIKAVKRIKPVVDADVIQKIISSINRKTFEGHRNLLIVLLLWDGMLRKNELLNLKTFEIVVESRLIKVFGKGRKERMVPLGNKTLRVLQQFISRWRSKFDGEHLICMRNGQPLKDRHCHKIIQQLGRRQGVELYPHLIRHSAATWYIRQGGNPVILQGIMGHTSLSVTQQYLHLSSQDALDSYNSYSPSNSLRI